MDKKIKFPKDFLWGSAVSSYQVEGWNDNSDWYEWEKSGRTKEKNGIACDYWNRYKEDHSIISQLGQNAFRLSLEWSKIEPEEGKFSEEAINHYREILKDLKSRGIKTAVTLWHWTLPIWLSKDGGWHNCDTVDYFVRFCERVVKDLGEDIDLFILMNEPRIPLNKGYLWGVFPPGKKNPFLYFKARKNMIRACIRSYDATKKINPDVKIGITQFTNAIYYLGSSKILKGISKIISNLYNWRFQDGIGEKQDFIGVNYYFAVETRVGYPFFKMINNNKFPTNMGWGVFPDGLREVLEDGWKRYKKPMYVFENGIAIDQDEVRAEFIKEHIKAIAQAIKNGADVRGYFYWSLMDNFEWNEGFKMKFGLVEIDRKTLERKIRPSAWEYAKICKNGEF
ncbi:MAG: glycoside hydrolase family 1 protein [Parcubacteria group bacterium]|jgi:beta-glucosidase|nr:glycoside hydrolase family 1 protein [Candidatus Moranbacteria bacterium]